VTDAVPDTDFTSPDRDRYFEDYKAGAVHVLGKFRVDGTKMLAFSREFDPQDIHIDHAKAAGGPFQGLIASGWYTSSLMMRLLARNFLSNVSSLGSPGIDGLRWLAPVRADDVLTIRVSIVEARLSVSKPDRGVVRSLIEVINQDDILVMDIRGVNLIACRK
jgi:acyl dehydratase